MLTNMGPNLINLADGVKPPFLTKKQPSPNASFPRPQGPLTSARLPNSSSTRGMSPTFSTLR